VYYRPIQDFYDVGHSITECANKFGFADVKWAIRHGLRVRSSGQTRHLKKLVKPPKNLTKCEFCGVMPKKLFGCGRFCRMACSASFGARVNIGERRLKIALTLKGRPSPFNGVLRSISELNRAAKAGARAMFSAINGTGKCSAKSNASRFTALQNHANGTISSWQSRLKLKPSYPEKVFMDWATDRGVSFTRELKQGRYFIDFALTGNVAIEIDGKQHQWPDRKIRDAQKDTFLRSLGWNILRIQWSNIKKAPWSGLDYLILAKRTFLEAALTGGENP
jgi:hypothetical protein